MRDVDKEMAEWRNQQDSTLFRRGMNMASSSEGFKNIVESLIKVTEKRQKIDILAVGIASGEEPLSVLSVADSIAGVYGMKLDNLVDLYVVDRRDELKEAEIQSRVYKHVVNHFLPGNRMVLNALEDDYDPMQYRVKKHIIDFLAEKLKDRSHSKWNTSVQRFVREKTGKKYDMILYNNVDGHILEAKGRDESIRGLVMLLKVGGRLVTDYRYGGSIRLQKLPDYQKIKDDLGLKEVAEGIFERTK